MNYLTPILILPSISILLIYIFNRRCKKIIEQAKKESDFYHQLIAIDMKNFNCKPHCMANEECNEMCSLVYQKTLQKLISSANSSICLCMYLLSLKSINYELIKAHHRGVKVRIITDKVMFALKPSQENFSRLRKNGIPFKVQPSHQSMMHHKFCLIDKEDQKAAKLFFGSLNLTSQGVSSNFDNTVVTNNFNFIARFSEEFEELWKLF